MAIYVGSGDCCKLVGNLDIGVDGIISISSRFNTEIAKAGDNIIVGPTTGVVSVSAYAGKFAHEGCSGRASVTIPWIRKYDCDNDKVYFIFSGEGESNVSGKVDGLITLNKVINSYRVINASASSGPATIYEDDIQYDGYGAKYTGDPWEFDTSLEESVTINTGISDYGPMFMQSFSLQFTANQVPTASYEFIYSVENEPIVL